MVDILVEDNHLFVLNKPAGLLTQPSGTDQDSLEAQAKAWIKEKSQKPGNVFLEAVHRLDKPVSGIVVFSKTSKGLSRLNAFMREKSTRKCYTAIVEGSPSNLEGVLKNYLIHDEFQARVSHSADPNAKIARLSYRVVDKSARYSTVEIELDTGRYHQIRAQFAHIGCPIVGDRKYGSRSSLKEGVIALHHSSLQIPHPITKEILLIKAPKPLYFDPKNLK